MAEEKGKNIVSVNGSFSNAVKKIMQPAPNVTNNIKYLGEVSLSQPASPIQLALDLGIEIEKKVGGIEMGVLQNGMPYLTQVGISNMSGAARKTVYEITQEWQETHTDPIPAKGRMAFFRNYLLEKGYNEPRLFIEITKNGSPYYAYPDLVCTAFIEYFAFEAQNTNKTAIKNFRNLARFGLHEFIYKALDYTPEDKWKYYTDRVSILKDSAPLGYFILFKETNGIAVDLINANLPVNEKTIPDISVGLAWGKFWASNKLDEKIGARVKYEHNYPDYYPQSTSNPQKPWAYPDDALALFRNWFRTQYLTTKFPKYILSKEKVLAGGTLEAERIAAMYRPNLLHKST